MNIRLFMEVTAYITSVKTLCALVLSFVGWHQTEYMLPKCTCKYSFAEDVNIYAHEIFLQKIFNAVQMDNPDLNQICF